MIEDKNNAHSTENHGAQEAAITLPCEKKDLVEFITKLLGQPQSIERVFGGAFDLNLAWILNTHQLLIQRVFQQNKGELVDFSGTIYFQDGRSQKFSSMESFQGYSEPKPYISVGAMITWTFLIQFPNKKVPERQEIVLHIRTDNFELYFNFIHPLPPFYCRIDIKTSQIAVQIDHTERTWGDDIEHILCDHIRGVMTETPRSILWKKYVLRILSIAILGLSVFMPMGMLTYVGSDLPKGILENFDAQSLIDDKIETLISKVDFLVAVHRQPKPGTIKYFGFYFFLSVILGGFIYMISRVQLESEKRSYLVLTPAAERDRAKSITMEQRSKWLSILSFSIAVLASVVANYLFFWFN